MDEAADILEACECEGMISFEGVLWGFGVDSEGDAAIEAGLKGALPLVVKTGSAGEDFEANMVGAGATIGG